MISVLSSFAYGHEEKQHLLMQICYSFYLLDK